MFFRLKYKNDRAVVKFGYMLETLAKLHRRLGA